jgi:two-component system, LuxR family, response regulator FixJ
VSVAAPALVLLVEDDEDVRRSVVLLLRTAGYEARAWASASEFLAEPIDERANCLVLDLRLPDMDGLVLLEAVREKPDPPPAVFLTGHGDIRSSVRAIRTGAFDFLEKPVEPERLLDTVERAVAHDRAARERRAVDALTRARFASLTPRELQVCRLVAAGLPNKTIAAELRISIRTVKVHRARVFQKMGVGSLADLVRWLPLLPGEPKSALQSAIPPMRPTRGP